MSDRPVHRILREDLNFHPHKMVMVQAINDEDTVNRKAEFLLNALDNDDLKHVLMMDEANFNFLWQCQFSKLSLLGKREPSRYSPETFTF